MMTASAKQGQETRRKNEAARLEVYQRREADKAEIRKGLIQIMNSTEATAAEKLEAARLISEIGL